MIKNCFESISKKQFNQQKQIRILNDNNELKTYHEFSIRIYLHERDENF